MTRRGQTTFDFAIGVSIFLSVLIFVFSFMPGVLQPFTAAGQQNSVISDRLADSLSQRLLGDPSEPYALDRHCTVEFFDGNSPSECEHEGGTLQERLGLAEGTNVNVTLEGNVTTSVGGSNLLCWDEAAHSLSEVGSGDCGGDVELAAGDPPPEENDASVTSRRVVALHEEDVTMKVVVW